MEPLGKARDANNISLSCFQVCCLIDGMSDSGPQLDSMGSLTMKSQLQITGKSFKKVQYLISLPPILT